MYKSNLRYILEALKSCKDKDEDIRIAKGKLQYPKTIKEVFSKWQ